MDCLTHEDAGVAILQMPGAFYLTSRNDITEDLNLQLVSLFIRNSC